MKLFETVAPPSKRMERQTTPCWPEVTQQIAFSSTGKVPNRNKKKSSVKPNKFHCKCVCFGWRKTREGRKICLKIHLFGFPETLVTSHAMTAARNVVSCSNLIGPFGFQRVPTTRPSTGGKRNILPQIPH